MKKFFALLTALVLLFKRPLLYLFGASDVTYPYASDYITIYLLGSSNSDQFIRTFCFKLLIWKWNLICCICHISSSSNKIYIFIE